MTEQHMTPCGDTIERYSDICKPAFHRIEKQLDEIKHSLNGNGKPGIITRLNIIEAATAGSWSIIKPILIAVLTAAIVGGGMVAVRPEPISADQIAAVVKQVIKEANK